MIVTELAFYLSILIYSALYDKRIGAIYLSILALYYLIYLLLPSNGKLNSLRRKIQIGSFSNLREGAVHYNHSLDVTNILAYLHKHNTTLSSEQLYKKVTITHVIIRAMAEIYSQVEGLNGRIICGKFIPFKQVHVSTLCDIDQGKDLAMIQVECADQIGISTIAQQINQRGARIKAKKDSTHKQQINNFNWMPPFLITIVLDLVNFFSVGLGLRLPGSGFKHANIVGCCLVTNVGMLGHVNTFASHNIATRVSNVVAVNTIKQVPVVIDNQVVIRSMCNINMTVDHRFLDGGKTKALINAFEDVCQNPEKYH